MRHKDGLRIVPLTALGEGQWADFVARCDECWLYHHPDFTDLNDRNCRAFGIVEGASIVGGGILYVNRSGLGKVLGHRYGAAGLAALPGIAARAYPMIKEHLIKVAREEGCHAIQMALPLLAPAHANAEYLDSHLCRLGFGDSLRWGTLISYSPSYSTVIDLDRSKDTIWREFSELIRRKCKLAARQAFEADFLQKGIEAADWDAFEGNHEATMLRGGAQALPANLRQRLHNLVLQGHAAVLNIKREGNTIASLLMLTYKRAAFYFASGLSEEAYRDGFAAQLHWSAIQELARRGYVAYEIGQFYPALAGTKLRTLGEFKRMFGGTKRRVMAGELVVNDTRMFLLDIAPAYLRQCYRNISASL